MLLTRVLRWFPGWVRVEAQGGYPETFFNRLTAQELTVWGVRCHREQVRFSCFARDYRALRAPARSACMRMRLCRKHGLPFRLFRYRRRKGVLIGLVLYAAVLSLLAPRVWAIEVVGNTDTPADSITAVAEEFGVKIGARTARLRIKDVEITGLDRLPTLAWLTVNPSGCVARLEVTERRPTPEVLDLSVPSDLVALRDGLVLSIVVGSGQRAVMVGEAVTAGTTLITGRVETALGEQLYRAYGEVIAQTQRQITVTVPLVYENRKPDGYVAFCPTLTFLCWEIPLGCRTAVPDNCLRVEKSHFFTAGGLTLPLGITNTYDVRTVTEKRARTEAEAVLLAAKELARQEESVLGDIEHEETDRRTEIRGRELVLTVTYRCRENIAVETPLT